MQPKRVSGAPSWRASALLVLLMANWLLVALAWQVRGRSATLHSGDLAAMSFSLGQLILLAAWCAWGTGRATTRWLVAVVSLAAITLTFSYCATQSLGRYSDAFFGLTAYGGILLAGWYALFLPLRWLLGWRLTLDHRAQCLPRGQFRLKHWLIWTAALSLPLAVARLLYPDEHMIESLFWCVCLALFSFPFVVVFFRAAFSARPGLWSAVAVVFAVVVGIAEESLVVYCLMDGRGIFTWDVRWMQIQQTCGMNLGLAAGLLGNLLILRLMGMRFASGRKVASAETRSTAVGWDKLALASAGPPE